MVEINLMKSDSRIHMRKGRRFQRTSSHTPVPLRSQSVTTSRTVFIGDGFPEAVSRNSRFHYFQQEYGGSTFMDVDDPTDSSQGGGHVGTDITMYVEAPTENATRFEVERANRRLAQEQFIHSADVLVDRLRSMEISTYFSQCARAWTYNPITGDGVYRPLINEQLDRAKVHELHNLLGEWQGIFRIDCCSPTHAVVRLCNYISLEDWREFFQYITVNLPPQTVLKDLPVERSARAYSVPPLNGMLPLRRLSSSSLAL